MSNYDDIIDMPRHVSTKHPPMPLRDRAARFAPFAALKGYDEAVVETARLTNSKIILDDNEIEQIDAQLQFLADNIKKRIDVVITHFVPDERKSGGAYQETKGILKKIDPIERKVIFEAGEEILIDNIFSIKMEERI